MLGKPICLTIADYKEKTWSVNDSSQHSHVTNVKIISKIPIFAK